MPFWSAYYEETCGQYSDMPLLDFYMKTFKSTLSQQWTVNTRMRNINSRTPIYLYNRYVFEKIIATGYALIIAIIIMLITAEHRYTFTSICKHTRYIFMLSIICDITRTFVSAITSDFLFHMTLWMYWATHWAWNEYYIYPHFNWLNISC